MLNKIIGKGVISNKDFWKFIKPFLSNKVFKDSNGTTLKLDNKIITKETKLVETFNDYCVDIDKQSPGLKPIAL